MGSFRRAREARLWDEVGTLRKQGDLGVALVYPSPYHVGMSSLGFQTVYRRLAALPGVGVERAFLPDTPGEVRAARLRREPLCTYESARPVGDFRVVAFSVAYELEIAGLIDCLNLSGIPPLAEDRGENRYPLIVAGGPLTFSNPVPAGPFADVMLLGEAEDLLTVLVEAVRGEPNRAALLAHLAALPGFYVPSVHGETPPPIAAADNHQLPAYSQIRTPHTELANMFLIEAERGCHRSCTYCVMRRSTNGGMRLVPPARVLELIPQDAPRVGLVGAAVTDHPGLPEILRGIVDAGREVGISSLRADRLNDEIVGLLKRGGYRSLTTAADGASERMRTIIERKTKERHLVRAAELVRAHGLRHLKLYMMLGHPEETDDDVDELGRFSQELARVAGKLVLGIAPFVAKRNTPLDGAPFAGVALVEDRLARLRHATKGRVELRPTSPKWAWVEYRLAQGGFAAGRAVIEVARKGGAFAAWKAAFKTVPEPAVQLPSPSPGDPREARSVSSTPARRTLPLAVASS